MTASAPAGRSTAKDGLRNRLVLFVLTHFAAFWRIVQGIRPLERRCNRWLINSGIKNAPNRPYRLTTMAPYTSWSSLTDKTFNARQLAPRSQRPGRPPVEEVADLFMRGEMIDCPKSTVLFAYVAQWFTDGFLRSKRPIPPAKDRDIRINESNHEVDLTQLYGSNRKETAALRTHEGGLLKSQELNGELF
ncbi:MAG: heme peroxidase, partial [Actinobacteria bacterium]|nr:heme peroxidase [Actinomycetota bacterium]